MNVNEARGFIKEMAAFVDAEADTKEQDAKSLNDRAAECLQVFQTQTDSSDKVKDLNRLITVIEAYGEKTKSQKIFAEVLHSAKEAVQAPEALPKELTAIISGYYMQFPRSPSEFRELEKLLNHLYSPAQLLPVWKEIAKQWIDPKQVDACTKTEQVIDLIVREIAQDLVVVCEKIGAFKSISPTGITYIRPILGTKFLEELKKQKLSSSLEIAEKIEEWIGQQADIKDQNVLINLSKSGIRHLPPVICKFMHTRTLLLDNNKLTELPEEITHMKGLKTISLSGNAFKQLPPQLDRIPKLRIVSCKELQPKGGPDIKYFKVEGKKYKLFNEL